MLNFAVGPVPSDPMVRALGGEDSPYFRTPEFSQTMLENKQMMCSLASAPKGSRAIFLTNSGTGALEAASGTGSVGCLISMELRMSQSSWSQT